MRNGRALSRRRTPARPARSSTPDLARRLDRKLRADGRRSARRALDREGAGTCVYAIAEAPEASGGRGAAVSVVADLDDEGVALEADVNGSARRAGVARDVGEGL